MYSFYIDFNVAATNWGKTCYICAHLNVLIQRRQNKRSTKALAEVKQGTVGLAWVGFCVYIHQWVAVWNSFA